MTVYPGREDEYDLGGGHSFGWLLDRDGRAIGIVEHHPDLTLTEFERGDRFCGGYVAWITDEDTGTVAKHQLVAGGRGSPEAEAALTIHPSLLCRRCANHGWIREGRWLTA